MRRFTATCTPEDGYWNILITSDDHPEIATFEDIAEGEESAEIMARDAIECYLCAVEGDDADLSFELTMEFES